MITLSAARCGSPSPRLHGDLAQRGQHLLGEEGNYRVQQPQNGVQRVGQDSLRRRSRMLAAASTTWPSPRRSCKTRPRRTGTAARAASAKRYSPSAVVTFSVPWPGGSGSTALPAGAYRRRAAPASSLRGSSTRTAEAFQSLLQKFRAARTARSPRPPAAAPARLLFRPLRGEVLPALGAGDPRQHAVLLRLLDQRFAVRALEVHRDADVLRFRGRIGQAESQRIGTNCRSRPAGRPRCPWISTFLRRRRRGSWDGCTRRGRALRPRCTGR